MELPARIGRYEVQRLLGQGGMGCVLLGRDSVLGREVALKVLRDDLGLTPELKEQLVERMRQEARAAATLSHPGMVTLHDMGEDDGVGLYLVFERIAGPTLRERIAEGGPLATPEVARLARTLGAALTHAHAAGVIHRDVKPENVMLAVVGPKLTDFGIARLPDSTLTGSTTVLGTPAYSAPEALASGVFGPASDQFSLAATLYEALTGQRAFPGEDALAVATRVATGKHVAPTVVLPALSGFTHLDVIFDRALAKDPKMRFASCEAFGNALAAELEGANLGYTSTPPPRWSIATRKTRKMQNVALLSGLLVIIALVVIGRFRTEEHDGVSLRDVAGSFSSTLTAHATPSAASHHPHPSSSVPVPVPVPASAPSSSPASASAPSDSPSDTRLPALDSRPADAGREHIAADARAADPVPADASQR